jgi:hypothetical protein
MITRITKVIVIIILTRLIRLYYSHKANNIDSWTIFFIASVRMSPKPFFFLTAKKVHVN